MIFKHLYFNYFQLLQLFKIPILLINNFLKHIKLINSEFSRIQLRENLSVGSKASNFLEDEKRYTRINLFRIKGMSIFQFCIFYIYIDKRKMHARVSVCLFVRGGWENLLHVKVSKVEWGQSKADQNASEDSIFHIF